MERGFAVAVFIYFEILKCLLRCICYLKMYILISIGDLTSPGGFPTTPLLLISCCIATWSAILLWSSASYQIANFEYQSTSVYLPLFFTSFLSRVLNGTPCREFWVYVVVFDKPHSGSVYFSLTSVLPL
jgi:hypothetical protein